MQAYSAGTEDKKSYGWGTAHPPVVPPPPRPPGYGAGVVTGADGGGGGLAQLAGNILRPVAIVTIFIATIVMGVNRQKGYKSTHISGLEYFVAVNAIALVYASGSLALSLLNQRSSSPNGKRLTTLVLTIVDVVMVGLLFSGIGSASAISVRFGDVDKCDNHGTFCNNMAAAIAMSSFGAAAFLALTVLSIVRLHTTSV